MNTFFKHCILCTNLLKYAIFSGLKVTMKCPRCDSNNDKVIESRTLAGGASVRRRRECLECGYRFTSYERIEEKPLLVIKKDQRREPFDRTKIERGVTRALEKRAVSRWTIEELINEIEDEAMAKGKGTGEVSASVIGDMVLEKLYKLDKVAYIRFASVYKHFENLQEFISEVNRIDCL